MYQLDHANEEVQKLAGRKGKEQKNLNGRMKALVSLSDKMGDQQ